MKALGIAFNVQAAGGDLAYHTRHATSINRIINKTSRWNTDKDQTIREG